VATRDQKLSALVGACLALALLLGPILALAGRHRPASCLRVTFLDVGQGDSAVIETPGGRVVVIDGGGHPGTDERWGGDPGARVVVPYLRSRGISAVDLIVPTHPDDDHVQGLNAVVARLTVRAALDGGFPGDSAPYQRLLDALRRRSIPIYIARRGQRIDLGDGASLEVLNPPDHPIAGAHSQTNNNSITLRLVYGRSRFLFTGDDEAEAESEMMTHCGDLSADVLKVGHHGSRWSSTDAFLDRVHPGAAIVSCGTGNVYNHPHQEVLDRLDARSIRIFRTDRQGAVIAETDGLTIRLRTVR
jgi:competence protein ComEC